MRKLFYCFSALLLCFMLTSCGDPVAKLEGIIDDIKENGKDWDADQWESTLRDLADAQLSFWKSEPDKKAIKEWDKLSDKLSDAVQKATKKEKAQKALEKAMKHLKKDDDFKDLTEEIDDLEEDARDNLKKDKDDDDDE